MGAPFKVARPKKCTFPPLGDFSGTRDDIVLVVFTVRQHHHGAGRFGVRRKPVQQVRIAEPTAVPWVATMPGLTEDKKSLTAATSVVRGH